MRSKTKFINWKKIFIIQKNKVNIIMMIEKNKRIVKDWNIKTSCTWRREDK
jgi:hypothetical protein